MFKLSLSKEKKENCYNNTNGCNSSSTVTLSHTSGSSNVLVLFCWEVGINKFVNITNTKEVTISIKYQQTVLLKLNLSYDVDYQHSNNS